jgi:hypothetical protein
MLAAIILFTTIALVTVGLAAACWAEGAGKY